MRRLIVPLALAAGCKTPVEAPAALSDLSEFLFTNFDNADPEVMKAGMVNLDTYLAAQDMTASKNDRSATLPILTGEALGTIVPPTGVDPNLQQPIGFWGESTHDFVTLRHAQLDPNQICMAANSDKYSGRTFTTDTACFDDGSCDTMKTTNEIRVETAIAKVWLDVNADFLIVHLDDGRDAMVSRANMPQSEPTDGGNKAWEQRFTIDAWIPSVDNAAPTERYYAMWSSTTAVTGDIYLNAVKGGLDEYFTNTDAFLDGTDCSNPRDRVYDRPAP